MESATSKSHVLQDLRNLGISEMRAVAELAVCTLRVDDSELQQGFAAMLVDETRHAHSLIEAVALLGGKLGSVDPGEIPFANEDLSTKMNVASTVRFLGRIAEIEGELPNIMRRVLDDIGDPTVQRELGSRLGYIARDEEKHRVWAREQLDRMTNGQDGDIVREALASVAQGEIGTMWRYANCRN